jgi:glycerophosphoryl diester phosphodiesterase
MEGDVFLTQIFAHRGSAGTHPENTMISFEEGYRAGADGIEIDVQLTKDGKVAVIHDEKLDRTTSGKGYIKDSSMAEIKRLNASHKYTGKYGKTAVPELEEVLDWLQGTNLMCNIELKNGVFLYPGMEEAVIRLVRAYRMEERIIFSSFNHYSLIYCHRLAPEIETAPLYRDGLFMPWIYARAIGAKAMHPSIACAPDPIIETAIKEGIKTRPYTINSEDKMKRLFEIRCSAIITDYPAIAVKLKKNYQ